MHQQRPTLTFLPNRSSSTDHRSGVSGRIVSFMLPSLSVLFGCVAIQPNWPLFGTKPGAPSKLTLTGSTEIGNLLMQQCAGTIKKLSLELGGNARLIVFDGQG